MVVRVAVVVDLTLAEATVLARAAVVVTSALDCKDANAAEQGLLSFRQAVVRALSHERPQSASEKSMLVQQRRRAS